MSVEVVDKAGLSDEAEDNARDWDVWQREASAGRTYEVEDVGSGYLFPRRAGRMALTSGFAENFQTDRVMPRRISIPEQILPPVRVGPENYLG